MSDIDRRQLLAAALAGAAALPALADAPKKDLIRAENDRDGTLDWQLTYTRVDSKMKWRSPMIEGFASHSSVRSGDALEFFVSTDPATPFTIDIYRMGYYRGKGGRHLTRLGPYKGKPQSVPAVGEKRLRECKWEPCTTLYIPKDWPSGVYLGKLSATKHRYQSYIVFIVRDDRAADFVFQCSDNTWQAYNQWPDGYSLYTNDRKDKKPLVSGVRAGCDRQLLAEVIAVLEGRSVMLTLPPSTRVFVASKPADMRRSFDGLMALVRDFLGEDQPEAAARQNLARAGPTPRGRCDRSIQASPKSMLAGVPKKGRLTRFRIED
jgi:hypothetical protein